LITAEIKGTKLNFHTKAGVFSPDKIDKGTLAMLSAVELSASDKVLDLGCGYGAVGIWAASVIGSDRVVMCDIDEACVTLSENNAQMNGLGGIKTAVSDGFRNLDDTDFTLILSNPPYHTDFSVAKHFIEKGFNRLKIGGKMVMVTKRKQWYKNKLTAIFGGVKTQETDGYFVFCAEKRGMKYANAKPSQAKASQVKPNQTKTGYR
jgi:16S rRNA (guanine1207-N2)-methyltransferase